MAAPEPVLRCALRLRRPLAALVDGLHYASAQANKMPGTPPSINPLGNVRMVHLLYYQNPQL